MRTIWYWNEKQAVKRLDSEILSDLVERAIQINGEPELIGPMEYASIGDFERQTGISPWRIQRATYPGIVLGPGNIPVVQEMDLFGPTSYEAGLEAEHSGFSFGT